MSSPVETYGVRRATSFNPPGSPICVQTLGFSEKRSSARSWIVGFDTEDEVTGLANATDFGLGAGVWTQDVGRAYRMAAAIESGQVWVNCYKAVDAALPFGGYKQSGWGREMDHEVLEAYTEVKAVTTQL